jgi:methionyl-tRNA formyltransferase
MKHRHNPLRIVFMGTPVFAVASLDILLKNGFDIAAVITAPDKPGGRGMKLQTTPVKEYALEHQLPILQPTNLKSQDFIDELSNLQADLFVIVAFRMLPVVVWSMPPLGSVNLHGSLLPDYRGAAPINWAIINGEKQTGVTTFFLQHEIDTGPIIFAETIDITAHETAGTLHDKMMTIGAAVLLKTVAAIDKNDYPQIPQNQPSVAKIAPKIFKETTTIQWDKSVDEIYNHVRGLSPYPAATTVLNHKNYKIFSVEKTKIIPAFPPATIQSDHKTYVHVYANDGFVSILELQVEGKKRMEIVEFLRGNKMEG